MIEWNKPKASIFSELKTTDTFLVADVYGADEIFMKIRECDDDNTNAISLKKGTPHVFSDHQIVTPVDLVIEYSART